MSLVSATGVVGGIKEYTYRGIQQLPIVLGTTSMIFTLATGSIAHMNLALGLAVLMPLYTYSLQSLLTFILQYAKPNDKISWTRSTGDSCSIVPSGDKKSIRYFNSSNNSSDVQSVPSFWLMEVAFFIGYALSNAIDSLQTPAQPNADPENIEKRNSGAIFLIIAICVLSIMVLAVRFTAMRGCEGRGSLGLFLSILSAAGAASIGYGVYEFSRRCGSRASDLFGILSQILPASSTAEHPIVCSADET